MNFVLGALIVFFTATINDPAFPTVDFGGGTEAIQFRAVCIPRQPYGKSWQYSVVWSVLVVLILLITAYKDLYFAGQRV